ncbi:MAG TPA: DUF4350 domain-containing protein [Kiritimatiellia bacterium]|jgi:hypothetical protein
MSSRKVFAIIFLVAALAALAYGTYGLIALRLTSGDAYPPYSSLRADPLGAKLLHDSLEAIGRFRVERNFRPLWNEPMEEPATVFILGARPGSLHMLYKSEARIINRFVSGGGRLVICFAPVKYYSDRAWTEARHEELGIETPDEEEDEEEDDGEDGEKRPAKKSKEEKKREKKEQERIEKEKERFEKYIARNFTSVTNTWGVDFAFARLMAQPEESTNTTTNPFDDAFDDEVDRPADFAYETQVPVEGALGIPWHSTLFFTNMSPTWRTLYRRAEYPVIIERSYGDGSIILASDPYFVSNEALVKERNSKLVSHLVGDAERILFDEEHFGIVEEPSVIQLASRYGLQGVLAALLVIAGLYIWKNATSLVPPPAAQSGDGIDVVAGEQAHEGFVRQLRRHLKPRDLPAVCLAEWRKTADPHAARHAQRLVRMQSELAAYDAREPAKRNPVQLYRAFCDILQEKKGRAP